MHRLTGFSSRVFIHTTVHYTEKTSFHTPPLPSITLVRPRTPPSEIDSSGCRPGYRKRSLPVCRASFPSSFHLFTAFFPSCSPSFFFPLRYCIPFSVVWFEWYLMNSREFEIWFVLDWGWLFYVQKLQILIEYSFLNWNNLYINSNISLEFHYAFFQIVMLTWNWIISL